MWVLRTIPLQAVAGPKRDRSVVESLKKGKLSAWRYCMEIGLTWMWILSVSEA